MEFYFRFLLLKLFFPPTALSPYFIILQQREDRICKLLKTRAFVMFFYCLCESDDDDNGQ